MPLQLHCHYDSTIRLEVHSVVPQRLNELSMTEIEALPVWRGRRRGRLDDYFRVSGEPSTEVNWFGNLKRVDRIGEQMTCGAMQVESTAGGHLGQSMSGGSIVVFGDVGHYAGNRMQGGRMVVFGDAGDHLGGVQPGCKLGMNRGEILVSGNVGRGAGKQMRRGTIVCGGVTGELAGWNMIAGTIMAFGGLGKHAGAGMKRGTLIDAPASPREPTYLLPTFDAGICAPVPILKVLRHWLGRRLETLKHAYPDRPELMPTDILDRLSAPFQMFHGDRRIPGQGEVLVATT